MLLSPLPVKELPKPLPLRKMLGPSFIILGLGLGSGEVILWPYLTAHYGLGIIWGALLGITFQFFMNMEIERYTLVHGESVFVGLSRKFKIISWWFLLSTFVPWIWPGIIASSSRLIGSLLGIEKTQYLAIALLILIGLILSSGRVLYKTVERFQKALIGIGVPSIFLLSILLASRHDWLDLAKGSLGLGNGYFLLPFGLPIASFLAALAYAGAGGNLNLAQSFYIREKGYGMGKYAGRITSILTGKREKTSLTGAKFTINKTNLNIFNNWWRSVNREHFVVFWLTGSVTILLLALLSYTTTYGSSENITGINFVLSEAAEIGRRIFPFAGIFFLLVTGLTLFGTQLTVYDATSRILTENLILAAANKLNGSQTPNIYYAVLWLQIAAGIFIFLFGFTEPLTLLTLAAVLNAFAMFIHTGLTLYLNLTSLSEELRPGGVRILAMVSAFLFYGGFSLYIIANRFFSL